MEFDMNLVSVLVRWLHVLSGVMWIGLLWYFNFVQTPTMPKIPDELKPAIGKHIAPAALFWFRWAAASTLFFGLLLAWDSGYVIDALLLGQQTGSSINAGLGIGMWLGIYMAFNVWFIIWPNQQKVLGMVEAEPDARGSYRWSESTQRCRMECPDASASGNPRRPGWCIRRRRSPSACRRACPAGVGRCSPPRRCRAARERGRRRRLQALGTPAQQGRRRASR